MNIVGLFLLGTLVTLIVGAALTLLIWGAILDGRDEEERRLAEAGDSPAPLVPVPTPTTRAA
jgi:hypothetical protein